MGPPLGVPWLVGPMTGWRQVRYSLNGPRHHTGRTAKGTSPVIVPVVVGFSPFNLIRVSITKPGISTPQSIAK